MALRKFSSYDLRILRCIEKGMSNFLYVPLDFIKECSRINDTYLEKRLKRLHNLGLIQRKKASYIGYILTSRGYDSLALNTLYIFRVIKTISKAPLRIGKESDIYIGKSFVDSLCVIKFHRAGRISFRDIKRKRTYIIRKKHTSWLHMAKLAAIREYYALNKLYSLKIKVPKPLFQNRHVLVMEYINGIPLSEKKELKNPKKIFVSILDNIKKAYKDAKIVHGDLSVFNILITQKKENSIIIDWPQWIPATHPSSRAILLRDIGNIINFFMKKYGLDISLDVIKL